MRNPSSREGLKQACEEVGVSVSEFDATGAPAAAGVRIRQLDVASDESVEAALDLILKETGGRIDVCVNNAGYAEGGTIENLTIDQAKKQFETNFFGVARLTKAVLPSMRERESGKMIVVSSVGGVNGTPFNDVYCASKFAVEGFYESLAPVYKQFKVWISIVEPGPILTSFIGNASKNRVAEVPEGAHPSLNKLKAMEECYMKTMSAGFNSPAAQTGDQVAQFIVQQVVDSEAPNVRYQTNTHPGYVAAITGKLVDPTGNNARDMMEKRFFSGL